MPLVVAQRGAPLAIGTGVSTSAGLLAPYVVGSVVEVAASPIDGFTGFMTCGIIMLVGGIKRMAVMRPERERMRWASERSGVAIGPAKKGTSRTLIEFVPISADPPGPRDNARITGPDKTSAIGRAVALREIFPANFGTIGAAM